MGRILHVRMDTGSISSHPLPQEDILLGGRALTSRTVARMVPPQCHPLGPNNILVFACGPLAGTLASSVNRLSVGGKSPLTGGIKESNAGGMTAYAMGRLHIRALVLEGQPAPDTAWQVLHLHKGGAELKAFPELAGLHTSAKAKALFEHFGPKTALALIGPAGEMRMLCAGIANTDPEGVPSRYAGRGGLGAVMGSKKLLAIVCDMSDAPQPEYHDKTAFQQCIKELARRVEESPVAVELYRRLGTAAMLDTTQALGALPTRNFRRGRFDGAEKINGHALRETILSRGGQGSPSHACMRGCVIRCSNIYPDAQGKLLCSPVEYENLGLLGSNLELEDLDAVARLNALCNELGCDTIEAGAALGVLMDAGVVPFGDAAAAEDLLHQLGRGTPLGRLVGGGAALCGKAFGWTRVPVVKDQAMPAYDPRSIKGLGVTYATSPQGADHTAGNTARSQLKQHLKDGQVAASSQAQVSAMLMDSLGLCTMLGAPAGDLKVIAKLLEARHGTAVDMEALRHQARKSLQVERDFNLAAGLSPGCDQIPEYMRLEENPDSQSRFDVSGEELGLVVDGAR